MALHGYLTRPANWQPGDPPPPLIMMPHGGPEARDRFSFNDDAQLLAAHGYQVFQPNFRGSSGFGRAFADAGRRQWGKAMQTDVDDAYAHLVAEGFAAEDRACILGHSYGGYVALAAATLTPELYRCVISINGVSHLEEALKRERREEGRDSEVFEYWTEHIGDLRRDRDELLAYSPAMIADRVVRPVLLVFSTEDSAVFPEQTELMHEALEEAGKSVTFLELEDSGHAYRTTGDQRREYDAILSFLAEHLPLEAADTAGAGEAEFPFVQP